MYIYIYICIHISIYRERERERKRKMGETDLRGVGDAEREAVLARRRDHRRGDISLRHTQKSILMHCCCVEMDFLVQTQR